MKSFRIVIVTQIFLLLVPFLLIRDIEANVMDSHKLQSEFLELKSNLSLDETADQIDQIIELAVLHPNNILIHRVLTECIHDINKTKNEKNIASSLQFANQKIQQILSFKRVKEDSANLPKGFPKAGSLGEIIIKDYPEYRIATTQKGWFQFSTFYRLFNHIKSNNISMTAPVEMNYREQTNDVDDLDMGFIYGNSDIGTVQQDGKVEVKDMPAVTVVSVGLNGKQNDKTIHSTAQILRKWLETNHPDYEISGSLRVHAYNSPMVPREKNFYEVQYPIQSNHVE